MYRMSSKKHWWWSKNTFTTNNVDIGQFSTVKSRKFELAQRNMDVRFVRSDYLRWTFLFSLPCSLSLLSLSSSPESVRTKNYTRNINNFMKFTNHHEFPVLDRFLVAIWADTQFSIHMAKWESFYFWISPQPLSVPIQRYSDLYFGWIFQSYFHYECEWSGAHEEKPSPSMCSWCLKWYILTHHYCRHRWYWY